jgi:adenine-specific DNA-methyltransferase
LTHTEGEIMELYRKPVSEIPIKLVGKDIQKSFIDKVDKIIMAKQTNPKSDTTAIEHEINLMIYELYGLTNEEISIVERLSVDKH